MLKGVVPKLPSLKGAQEPLLCAALTPLYKEEKILICPLPLLGEQRGFRARTQNKIDSMGGESDRQKHFLSFNIILMHFDPRLFLNGVK